MKRIDFLIAVLLGSMSLYTYINLGEKDIAFGFTFVFMMLYAAYSWAISSSFRELRKICNVMESE